MSNSFVIVGETIWLRMQRLFGLGSRVKRGELIGLINAGLGGSEH